MGAFLLQGIKNMTVPMTTIISICVAIITGSFSIFFGIKSKGKSDNHELIENTRITTELAMTLKEVAKNVEKIMNEMTDTKERMHDFDMRIQMTESGVKEQAKETARIDSVINKLDDRLDYLEKQNRQPIS